MPGFSATRLAIGDPRAQVVGKKIETFATLLSKVAPTGFDELTRPHSTCILR
jgi:hypothetical protein